MTSTVATKRHITRTTLWILGLCLMMSGCAHVLPPAAREDVNPYLELRTVREYPDDYVGQTLLAGGLIVDHELTPAGSRLEILSYTLDRWGRPLRADENTGRFLVDSDRILDPALYEKGRQATLTGVIKGVLDKPLGASSYSYPHLALHAIYLWPKYDPSADPVYYRPYYDPFWPHWPYYHPNYYPYRPYPFGRYHPWW